MAVQPINITLTTAGLNEIINAEKNGTAPVLLQTVKFSDTDQTVDVNTSQLTNEVASVTTLSGANVGDGIIHILARDESAAVYSVRAFGIYTDNGTLFGVYSQAEPIIQKVGASIAELAIDFLVQGFKPTSVTFGDANFLNPPATTETAGVAEIATSDEVKLGNSGNTIVTPATLSRHLKDDLGLDTATMPPGGYGSALNSISETLKKGKVEFVASAPSDKQPNTLYVEPFNGEVFL